MALTTLANVKQYIYGAGQTATTDDKYLLQTLNQLSGAILDYIQRPVLFKTTYTERRDGVGNTSMTLRNYPVLSVSSLTVAAGYNYAGVGNGTIPAASSIGQSGYLVDLWDGTIADNPHRITLNGYCFPRGKNNVQIVYTAGYSITETYTISSTTTSSGAAGLDKYTALQPYGTWGQDDGVVYASSGVALTSLPSSASSVPTAGQYVVTNGVYQFSGSDNGLAVKVSYSYIPSALEQACIQWVAERYSYKSRIGQKSKSLGGNETASYDLKAIPDFVEVMVNPYKKWMPL